MKNAWKVILRSSCAGLVLMYVRRDIKFYEKNGFRFMNAEDNDPHTRLMYYDLMNLVA